MLQNNISVQISIDGMVQGIGLRPRLYQLARNFHLTGYCQNTESNVMLNWQGTQNNVDHAVLELRDFLKKFGKLIIHPKNVTPHVGSPRLSSPGHPPRIRVPCS